MQLISCSTGLRIDIRAEKQNYTAQGHMAEPTRALYVQFQHGGSVPDYARTEVEKLPGFRAGIGRDEDPYLTRLGWFDTAVPDWTPEEREFVEQRLLQIADPNVLVLEQQRVAAPYGKYDQHRKVQGRRNLEHVMADIQAAYDLAGFSAAEAVVYEQQNLNDPQVVEFLSGLGVEQPAVEEELVVA